jgi:hypothetical protein
MDASWPGFRGLTGTDKPVSFVKTIGPEIVEIQNCAAAANEMDVYSSKNFDCDDRNDAPMLTLASLYISSRS